MLILLFFAFLSGLVTILAPCIWPLLPIVLSAAGTGGKHKPLGITLGIATSFAAFTLSISYLVMLFHFDPNVLRVIAVVVIAFLGFTLLVPAFTARLEAFVSQFAGRINVGHHHGFWGGFVTGLALGLIWSPCAGPILASIASLSVTLRVNWQVILLTGVYVTGVAIPLFFVTKTGTYLNKYLGKLQQVFGVVMIATALAILTNFDKTLQAKLLNLFPSYSNFLLKLEDNSSVQQQLNMLNPLTNPNLGHAPDFVGVTHWLNTDKPISLKDLRGKVVLVDFWTYTCINCIRTLPHVVAWDQKYRDRGLVIIGIHTPEFEFEKKTENVQAAIKQFGIKYPVGQDNDYAVWNAYANHYWPAKYLIDKDGIIRYTHFGEGDYDVTEKKIQELLGLSMDTNNLPDQTPTQRLSPETYLGSARAVPGSFSLGGQWTKGDEDITAGKDATLEINFVASKVFLVMRPPSSAGASAKVGQAQVKVFLDGALQ
ncbi:redoxin domain-containing protein, partial [Candidatus Microgenomates bacterium]|nr:redoxin domain-containing protein [Candidatus Microgenomates bacterium]